MNYPAIVGLPYATRMQANREKRRKVLAFLRSEIWTVPGVLQVLLGEPGRPAARQEVHRLVNALVRDDLVMRDEVDGRVVVGITATGQAEVAAILGKEPVTAAYQQGRLPRATLDHRLDLQRLRITLAKAGWTGWLYPDRQPAQKKASKNTHRPDVIVTTPEGVRVAIECERTIKTSKRYRFILGRHLDAISRGEYAHVLYCSPTVELAAAVQKIIHGLGHAVVAGVDKKLTEAELSRFGFLAYDDVPNWQPTKEH